MIWAKTKLLNTPLVTSLSSTTSLREEKKAAKEMAMRSLATETNAPPSQPTGGATVTTGCTRWMRV